MQHTPLQIKASDRVVFDSTKLPYKIREDADYGKSFDSLGDELVARTGALVARFPRRLTGTPSERWLQQVFASELERLGADIEWHAFSWGQSIYASLALHFGLATAGTIAFFVWSPIAAAAIHFVVATSYFFESVYKRPLLRHLLPRAKSQNAIATFKSRKPMKHRIVTLAHADAAYTGLLFTPSLVRMAAKETTNPIGRMFRKGLALATFSLVAAAILEAALTFARSWSWSGSWLAAIPIVLLSLPAFLAFVLNADVVARNRVVPAANDNLSGCVASLELARRLGAADPARLPDDIELVVVITGCEEAGAGGASMLARAFAGNGKNKRWLAENTTTLSLDTFSNGDPRLLQEGELIAQPLPPKLHALANRVCADNPSLGEVTPYEIPSGATDAWPFLIAGFESMAITCIDPSLGAPRHYHLPSDTAENLDAAQFERTFRFTEAFIAALAAERSSSAAKDAVTFVPK